MLITLHFLATVGILKVLFKIPFDYLIVTRDLSAFGFPYDVMLPTPLYGITA